MSAHVCAVDCKGLVGLFGCSVAYELMIIPIFWNQNAEERDAVLAAAKQLMHDIEARLPVSGGTFT